MQGGDDCIKCPKNHRLGFDSIWFRARRYVASPLGFSVPTRLFYETRLLTGLAEAGFAVLDPWELPPSAGVHDPVVPMVIGEKNALMIQEADAVLRRGR